ncbi:hypothetical protein Cyrtocomes_00895 [Candidatus Cyrtobacter comes]|uniref:Uncharacterized protein n=1 Tax=Candidatus Cyrtobacter comes TaxID=675776 RepID=A0ABU5L8R4_9RICK|nr:hypothetical protein [Candidatus Cyrtobacter comes]MDZ5762508.1 hypothetical protein [Candidatus Cyrtobacter comes]
MRSVTVLKEDRFPILMEEIKNYVKASNDEEPLLEQLMHFSLSSFQNETGISPNKKLIQIKYENFAHTILFFPILPILKIEKFLLNGLNYEGNYKIKNGVLHANIQSESQIEIIYTAGLLEENLAFQAVKGSILEHIAFSYEKRGYVMQTDIFRKFKEMSL